MDSKEGHTPTPWIMDEVPTSCGRCFRIGSEDQVRQTRGSRRLPSYACLYDDYGAGENQAKANAALIVRAVNSHKALVEALTALVEEFGSSLHSLDKNGPDLTCADGTFIHASKLEDRREVIAAGLAALRLAGEDQS